MKKSVSILALTAWALACSSAPKATTQSTAAPATASSEAKPALPAASGAALTPTPTLGQRTNPNLVEDTPTYSIERLPKDEYIRVDDTHVRSPVTPLTVKYFKEDDKYFYVYTPKVLPDEQAAAQAAAAAAVPTSPGASPEAPAAIENHGMPPEDFEDLTPARVSASFHFEPVAQSGLPGKGMWRHSFAIADLNGDGIPDIVAPPARLGADNSLHVWLGDGTGKFARQKLTFTEDGKVKPFTIFYGGVAVGDIDGDGKLDVVTASHGGGISALFGEGDGKYAISRKGLPRADFSTQAIALVDVNGDGKLDIVASSDKYEAASGRKWDEHQLKVYLSDGHRGFTYAPDALVDGAYSNALTAWDYNGDGRPDILTGSQAYSAVQLVWKNTGQGKFETAFFPEIEIYGFHFAVATGTFGRDRIPAYADAFTRSTRSPQNLDAEGLTVYSYKDGAWTRHRVWRKKSGRTTLWALAMGDLDGDGLDDLVMGDSSDKASVLRIFLQQPDGSFKEVDAKQEPHLDSPAQCIRLADVDKDGRLDIVVSKTYYTGRPDPGGWSVLLNRK